MNAKIALDYVDRISSTIIALKAWRVQEWKATHGKDLVEEIETRLTSTTSHLGSTPVTGSGGNRVETAMAEGIHQKEIAEHGFLKACEYMEWMLPCWEQLTEDERYILTVRFIDHEEYKDRKEPIRRIMHRYCIEQSEVYNRSREALEHLAKLLYW